jgi:lactate permease
MTLFLLSLLPFVVLFVLLIPFRRPAYEAAPVAYVVTVILALVVWQVSGATVAASVFNTLIVFFEVLLIITLALLVLNVMIETGTLDTIKTAIANITAGDHRSRPAADAGAGRLQQGDDAADSEGPPTPGGPAPSEKQ